MQRKVRLTQFLAEFSGHRAAPVIQFTHMLKPAPTLPTPHYHPTHLVTLRAPEHRHHPGRQTQAPVLQSPPQEPPLCGGCLTHPAAAAASLTC